MRHSGQFRIKDTFHVYTIASNRSGDRTIKKYLWSVGGDVYLTQDTHVRDKWIIKECEKGNDITYQTSTDKSFYIKIGIGLAVLVLVYSLFITIFQKTVVIHVAHDPQFQIMDIFVNLRKYTFPQKVKKCRDNMVNLIRLFQKKIYLNSKSLSLTK